MAADATPMGVAADAAPMGVLRAEDAEAAVLALVGRVDGPERDPMAELAERQRALLQERRAVQKEMNKEKRKRKRIVEKTKLLTDGELVRELAARAKARAKAKAAA
jgi:hypothetical protein